MTHSSWPFTSQDVFECYILLVIDHTHHRSKVSRQYSRCLKIPQKVSFNIASEASFVLNGQKLVENVTFWVIFARFDRTSWPVTPYVKSIGYWVLMCYCLVFYCILEYCVILSLKKTFSNNQTRNIMDFEEESNDEKRIRIVLKIEKISRICVPIYLLFFSVGYFIIMTNM